MKSQLTHLIIITHKYIPFKPNVHENSELKVIDLCVIRCGGREVHPIQYHARASKLT